MKRWILILTGLWLALSVSAQWSVTKHKVTVDGTSNLRDWSVETMQIRDKITPGPDGQPLEVELWFNVKSMESGRGAMMNQTVRNTLKETVHPDVHFSSKNLKDEGTKLSGTGTLNICGVSQAVSLNATLEKQGNDWIISGTFPLKFSQFQIKPPSALFGQVVCDDEIKIVYSFTASKK